MIEINTTLEMKRKDTGGFEVLINGLDIAPYITSFSLGCKWDEPLPKLTVEIPISVVSEMPVELKALLKERRN